MFANNLELNLDGSWIFGWYFELEYSSLFSKYFHQCESIQPFFVYI